jgi:hypothetical protein
MTTYSSLVQNFRGETQRGVADEPVVKENYAEGQFSVMSKKAKWKSTEKIKTKRKRGKGIGEIKIAEEMKRDVPV